MKLTTRIKRCKKCSELAENRTQVVIGEGPIPCALLFLGEAPGHREDISGSPFCGVSGDMLEAAAFKAGLKRHKDYHILNILKCRPPENRDPTKAEIENCRPFLLKQLEVVSPKVIIAFGRYAQSFILGTPPSDIRVLRNAGKIVKLKNSHAVLSYHPAYVLRNRGNDIAKAFYKHFALAKRMTKGKVPRCDVKNVEL
jgi:uracil-DNA glycosylase family 4